MFRVAVLASTETLCVDLCARVERAALGAVVNRSSELLTASRVSVLRRIKDSNPDVLLIEMPLEAPDVGVEAIRNLHAELVNCAIFAVGDLSPSVIVSAMQGGACEFLERQSGPTSLLEAFARLVSRQKEKSGKGRGEVFAVLNAKGGSGATTVALNTAIALKKHGSVALVDLAPLGNLAVHLDVRPTFGVREALQNLHRMDATLLAGFITETKTELHLLAGSSRIVELAADQESLAHLFDLLASLYDYVVVDLSTRLDVMARALVGLANTALLVSQAEFSSLWTASRVRSFLAAGQGRMDCERVGLVLNRVRDSSKVNDAEIEKQTGCKVLWKVPNQYEAVATAIESGEPVIQIGKSEVANSYAGLAAALANHAAPSGEPRATVISRHHKETSKSVLTRLLGPELSPEHTI